MKCIELLIFSILKRSFFWSYEACDRNILKNIIYWSLGGSLFISTSVLYAQDFLPAVTTNPEVAMLGKFGEFQVGEYTGVPHINIPLYTIIEDGIEVPIFLRYNSSGIKVEEEATWVGLGWDLSVGGSITQVPMGDLDQHDQLKSHGSGYTSLMNKGAEPLFNNYMGRGERGLIWAACVSNQQEDSYITFDVARTFQWGQPDIYSFSLLNKSGRFYKNPETGECVQMGAIDSYLDIKEENPGTDWSIIDMDGIKYEFKYVDREFTTQYPPKTIAREFVSATWRLSNIQSPSGREVQFSYKDGKSYTSSKSMVYYHNNLNNPPLGFTSNHTRTESYTNTHHTKYLSEIETTTVRVLFELSDQQFEREDLEGDNIESEYSAKRLNAIHIWDKITDKKIKSFEFHYGYFDEGCNEASDTYNCKRLKLLKLKEVGYSPNGNAVKTMPAYSFFYFEDYQLPHKTSYNRDHWGYYNGESNSTLIPDQRKEIFSGLIDIKNLPAQLKVDLFSTQKANRGMRESHAKAGILKQITYPTGGYTVFEYESNTFNNYSILSADEVDNGNAMYSEVNLLDNNACSNGLKTSNKLYPDEDGNLDLYEFRLAFRQIHPPFYLSYLEGSYVRIFRIDQSGNRNKIHEWNPLYYNGGENFNQTGKTTFESPIFNIQGSASDYYEVEVFLNDHPAITTTESCIPLATASVAFYKINPSIEKDESIGGGLRISSIENFDYDNTPLNKKIYSYIDEMGNTSGKLMSPLKYFNFNPLREKIFQTCSGSLAIITETIGAYEASIASFSYSPISYDAQGAIVGYSRVEVMEISGEGVPNGKTVYYFKNRPSTIFGNYGVPNIPYEDNGLKDSTVTYSLKNGSFQKVKEEKSIYSSIKNEKYWGVVVVDKYRGPDTCHPCNGVINPYAYSGRWSINYYPLQTRWYVQSQLIEREFYEDYNVSKFSVFSYNSMGQIIEVETQGSTGEKIIKKFRYPIDNSLDESYSNSLITPMINKNLYNLILEQQSLRGDQEVNYKAWNYTNNNTIVLSEVKERNRSESPTYHLVSDILHDADNNIIQYTHNGITTCFLWGYKGSKPIAKIINASYNDILGVLGNPFSLRGENGNTLNIEQIQALTKGLPNAQLTTYAYDYMLRMTSQTDFNGNTVYYGYDGYGRLENMKDQNLSIVEFYKYKYKVR